MSEKRQRKQQRRQRRKAGEAARPRQRGGSPDRMLDQIARLAADSIREVADGFEAEQWASNLLGTWRRDAPPGEMVDIVLFQAFVRALQRRATADALAALRALSAVAAPLAGDAADELAADGLPEPPWLDELGRSRPVAAALLDEPAFDDGVSVLVEFAEPSGEFHTLSVYIDHNVGGLVKDVFLADRLARVRATMDDAPDRDRVRYRDLDLAEARARIESALDSLDHTFDPPVDEDVYALRALIEARMRLLPDGVTLPDTWTDMPREERDALLTDFLADEGQQWRGDEDAEFIAQLAIDFGAGYNHGGPLRWSPVVVEIFMLDWLGRKITEEPAFFERVPEVLATWVSYAGRRRGVPDDYVREAVQAVAEYRDEMLETVDDPRSWGPAKIFATAARDAGVDLSDPDAVERFIQQYNERGRPGS